MTSDRKRSVMEKSFAARELTLGSLKLNGIALFFNLVALAIYSFLKGLSLQYSLTNVLAFLLLVDAGIFFFSAGAYVVTSGINFSKIREQIFHSEGWSPEEYKHSEAKVLPWIMAGVLTFTESIIISVLFG